MARDYINSMTPLIAADNQREARRVVVAFQNKVVKYLESTLGPADSADQTRIRLATYTASRSAIDDLNKMRCVLRARRIGRFRRCVAGGHPEFRRRTRCRRNGFAGRNRQNECRHGHIRAGAAGRAAGDPVAIDPVGHQGRGQQGYRRHRRHALCDHGLDGSTGWRTNSRSYASRCKTTGS